jgi:hypothetical protein
MGEVNYSQPKVNPFHPFKLGIKRILCKHFSPSIVSNFDLIFEVEKYVLDKVRTANLLKQMKDQNFVCEVYYKNPSGLLEFICDLFSWETEGRTEAHLLKMITDKFKTGKIGRDWMEDKGMISKDVTSGKFETPNSEITKYMAHEAMKSIKKGDKN